VVTKRICLGLQRSDQRTLEQGVETGIIRQLPAGGFVEETTPLPEAERAVLESRASGLELPADRGSERLRRPDGGLERVRGRLKEVLTESVPPPSAPMALTNGSNGHPPGQALTTPAPPRHDDGDEPAAGSGTG
jgi:ubiquinol-cytochrome c reductase cytochrome b subunit